MSVPNTFVSKLFEVFMNMEGMMGKVFDEGLNNLKAIAEKPMPMEETKAKKK
jgi:hypothetical protein